MKISSISRSFFSLSVIPLYSILGCANWFSQVGFLLASISYLLHRTLNKQEFAGEKWQLLTCRYIFLSSPSSKIHPGPFFIVGFYSHLLFLNAEKKRKKKKKNRMTVCDIFYSILNLIKQMNTHIENCGNAMFNMVLYLWQARGG